MTVLQKNLIREAIRRVTTAVFHYTSSEGLIGILDSKRLCASEASSLNDLAEIQQGWNNIRDWLGNQPKSDVIDLLSACAAEPMRGRHEVFVLSGSTAADDANQWRLYANEGTGYAIELDSSIQLAAATNVPAAPSTPGRLGLLVARDMATVTAWLQVLYAKSEIEAALQELVAAVESECRSIDTSATSEDERASSAMRA